MADYIGKICPYCRTELREDDEIVICSSCEMPHHKDCWIENKGCTTFGCQGTVSGIEFASDVSISSAPKYSIRDAVQEQIVNRRASFCGKCGASLVDAVAFCSKCGTPIRAVQVRVSSEFASTGLDPEMGAYIGNESDNYLKVFSDMKGQHKNYSWNWPAFFLAPFWFLYRKMYVPGGALLAVYFLLTLIEGAVGEVLLTVVAIITGIFANYFYMQTLEQKLARGRSLREPQRSQYIAAQGGTNLIVAILAAAIYVLICAVVLLER